MIRIGYALSSEEHPPNQLVENARRAEERGFEFALVSDHFHPWIDKQGHSPFVWSVIGGIAQRTDRLRLGTGVTCPTIRIHPAIVAQAAATCETMMPGRFFLGVGTGENLNEHVIGTGWPPADVRLAMLEEAIEVVRELWRGEETSFHGDYYDVQDARIYTLPERLPEIVVAANKPEAARLAGRLGDGLCSTAPAAPVVETFRQAGGEGKPCFGMVHVCYAPSEAEARRTAHEHWPNAAIGGDLGQELPRPRHFEQAARMVREEEVGEAVPCGPDPAVHLRAIQEYIDAGFDHVYIHQIGPDQERFLAFCEREILPTVRSEGRFAA
jgi:coenzyme F420-dependent glucose-6-phosphate dehydrogenase